MAVLLPGLKNTLIELPLGLGTLLEARLLTTYVWKSIDMALFTCELTGLIFTKNTLWNMVFANDLAF